MVRRQIQKFFFLTKNQKEKNVFEIQKVGEYDRIVLISTRISNILK